MATKTRPLQVARRIVLGIILVGLTVLTVLHQKIAGFPSIDALDPFGGLETLMKFVAGGELIKRIEPGTLVLFGGILALGVVLSRFFCGWLCGFGALQGTFGWIGKKLFGRRFTVPARLDKVLRWLKYLVLAVIVAATWTAGELVIRPYDPLAAYGHISAGITELWAEFAVGLVLLVLTLVLSMFYERVFCKYLCPLGAVNAILGRIPLFRLKRVESTCISCAKCDRSCPMDIDVSKAGAISSPECISCMECVSACPTKKNSIVATLGGKAVKVGLVVALGFGIYLGAAAIGQALGALRFAPASLSSLAEKGSLSVADIKGSSTWEGVAQGFGIEIERLFRESGVPGSKVPASTMLKDTGKVAGLDDFEVDAVRVAVAKILGIPYAGETGDAGMGEEGKQEAAPQGAVTPEAAAAAAPAAKPAPSGTVPAKVAPSASAALVVPADFSLEGTLTIDDVAKALGASPEAVIAKLGLPEGFPRDKTLRDLKDQYGYTMPALKLKIKE